ncbi:LysR family DNA-binding transcriptional regulator [Vibrio nigripulchritudo ATCC 27043]|uniref:LysR substrate-binding domain-containing protein n=1 Tax=Vibrio nigripulchritudo TaxID=28173 RepID=UPI00021C3898|nr:LysR substrate-binding domain-containing protein [Vibrio nigripulchritudo]EGU52678.1 LysR family DNA-binding transcriptional regulator [Vibrio nigripulchritudo ATCC 27043]CCN35383.1 putative Transcriptional regulator, LysR family [Vibrio nigripulchritudo AM115]CCN39423.1 putative Transcriptional regulator, LysR family [Vibrio nigripulchritudo FTn2]CCN63480.1 putative Transcriptional regulator, LysR family [Vibrio nigripulchritudo POn4]CCN78103.1 putative Transcriptional regulator, LysR fami
MEQWEGVTEFVAVAEQSSFTLAAQKLSTSVAQVSRKISKLEQRLSVKLLLRTTRKVTLTDAGKVYYQHCRHLVDGLEFAEQAVTELQSTLKGKIKLTAPVTYGEQMLAPVLSEFLTIYPEVELDFHLSNQKLDMLEHGFDLAIRLGHLGDSTYIAKRLGSRQMHVCASPDYIEKHGEPRALLELSQHQCLIGNHPYWRFIENGHKRQLSVEGRMTCDSGRVLINAALNGIGIVQLPDYYVHQHMATGKLVELLTDFRDTKEGIWALYPNNRYLSSKVRLLIDFLAERLSIYSN